MDRPVLGLSREGRSSSSMLLYPGKACNNPHPRASYYCGPLFVSLQLSCKQQASETTQQQINDMIVFFPPRKETMVRKGIRMPWETKQSS